MAEGVEHIVLAPAAAAEQVVHAAPGGAEVEHAAQHIADAIEASEETRRVEETAERAEETAQAAMEAATVGAIHEHGEYVRRDELAALRSDLERHIAEDEHHHEHEDEGAAEIVESVEPEPEPEHHEEHHERRRRGFRRGHK